MENRNPAIKPEIAKIRREYRASELLETKAEANPVNQFAVWFEQALKANLLDANAMIFSTANADGLPSARVLLLKGFDEYGFSFFTNYDSRKGHDLEENPNAAMTFYWAELERQVRVEGSVEKLARRESEAYFHSRPRESQIGAWISRQSRILKNREELEKNWDAVTEKFRNREVPLPEFWGGYLLRHRNIEFWQGRPNRLHDRLLYEKNDQGEWTIRRLAP